MPRTNEESAKSQRSKLRISTSTTPTLSCLCRVPLHFRFQSHLFISSPKEKNYSQTYWSGSKYDIWPSSCECTYSRSPFASTVLIAIPLTFQGPPANDIADVDTEMFEADGDTEMLEEDRRQGVLAAARVLVSGDVCIHCTCEFVIVLTIRSAVRLECLPWPPIRWNAPCANTTPSPC